MMDNARIALRFHDNEGRLRCKLRVFTDNTWSYDHRFPADVWSISGEVIRDGRNLFMRSVRFWVYYDGLKRPI